MSAVVAAAEDFVVPAHRVAPAPPEHRGVPRDGVNLLVARPGRLTHTRFRALPRFVRPADLLVVNTSRTLPAAIDGTREGRPVVVHLSTRHDDEVWVVELRRPDGRGPVRDGRRGDVVALPAGGRIRLLGPVTPGADRLWRAQVTGTGPIAGYLARHGRAITYGDTPRWPLAAYQTVFGDRPGSAEMASAARPFTPRVVVDLVRRGVGLAPVVLHAGVSSAEAHEPPAAEWYHVPAVTARRVEQTRRAGGRVIAVGTTVTRALESVAAPDGSLSPGSGWTELVLGPERPARVVQGLLTGWHEADASHLLVLEAVAGAPLVARAYAAALAGPYLWHEFGDSCLLLPALPRRGAALTPPAET